MITKIADFTKAKKIAEDITDGTEKNIKDRIENAMSAENDRRDKKAFYEFLGSLLLNTVLNRADEFEGAKERALEGRIIIKEIMNKL